MGYDYRKKKDKKKKITGEGVNNSKLVKVFPNDNVDEQVDPAHKDIESKQKKQNQLKKQVLQKKLQAVRSGGGEDITASCQPEGEVTEEKKSKKLYKGNPTGPSKKPEGGDRRPGVKEEADLEVKPKKKEEVEDDYRAMWTKANLVRNKLRAMGLKMSHEPEGDTINEKLAAGHKGKVGFSSGEDDKGKQVMKTKNPRTGRMRGTSPESKAIGAHSRHKQKQWDAEAKGDHKAAAKHKSRRDAQSFKVYQKTKRIIDRADND